MLIKLARTAGSIWAASKACQCVILNIFEGELEGAAKCLQHIQTFKNVLHQLQVPFDTPVLHGDNMAAIEFIQGRGEPKEARHIQLRLWFLREHYQAHEHVFEYTPGAILQANFLTKLGNDREHNAFAIAMLGLSLIGITDIKEYCGYEASN